MDAGRWFATTSFDGASAPVTAAIRELLTMLDAVQPTALDLQRSHIVNLGHDWAEYEVEVLFAHRDDEADVTLALGPAGALVAWLTTHEHVYPQDGSGERSWTTVVVDAVAALLRGEYVVEEHYRGDALVKTTVRDLVDDGREVTTTGSLFALLPILRCVDRVERRTIDFGCLG